MGVIGKITGGESSAYVDGLISGGSLAIGEAVAGVGFGTGIGTVAYGIFSKSKSKGEAIRYGMREMIRGLVLGGVE